jgi:hypothetical protein
MSDNREPARRTGNPLFNRGGDISNVRFQESLRARYDELVEAFGGPNAPEALYSQESDVRWTITGQDGTVATIYNWKDGPAYLGSRGTPVEDLCDWHVAGHDRRAVELVQAVLEAKRAKPDN